MASLLHALSHKRLAGPVVAIALAAIVFALVYFQPQDLFINHTVHQSRPAQAVVVRQGGFHSGEHHTTGVAQLLAFRDGLKTLRLAPFRTSNGPAVHVWLSAAAPGASNGTIAGSGHVDLGALKGNIGDQNYAVPRAVDLGRYRTVVIWCERFSVTFGYAPLTRAAISTAGAAR
jgi:hypothetical protein